MNRLLFMKRLFLIHSLVWALVFGGMTAGSLLHAQDAVIDRGQPQTLPSIPVHVGKAMMQVEVTSTPEQRELGLMYRKNLPDNEGMSFALPLGVATFWMKNTLIPLSIAFIDQNGTILEIHDMKALDTSILRSESNQVAYALEANLHWFALNGVKVGDKLDPPPATWAKPATP